MISVTSAQLDAWLAAFIFPLARIGALMMAAPVFSNAAVPQRMRLIWALVVTVAMVPALPSMPAVPAGSWIGLGILAQQILIGVLLGFTLRIVFTAIDVAGQLIGLQMGLSFATFYDPINASQTPVIAEFLSLLTTLIFLAMNGHLLAFSALAESFRLMPVTLAPLAANGISVMISWAATIFIAGVLLSLPLVAALMIANIAMGVLSRVAPSLNLFAVGFPVTLAAGFLVILVSLPYFGAAMEKLFDQGFMAMAAVMRAGAGG